LRILFIVHRVPYPPDKGDKIRSFNILSHLAESHDVHCAFPIHAKNEYKYVEELRKIVNGITAVRLSFFRQKVNQIKNLFTGKSLSEGHFWSKKLKHEILSITAKQKFDAVFVYSSSMARYVDFLDVPVKIIDFCDLDSAKFNQYSGAVKFPLSYIYKLEAKRLAQLEKRIIKDFDKIMFITKQEKQLFDYGKFVDKIVLLGNGVSVDKSAFYEKNPVKLNKPALVFTGQMDYLPNIDAVIWFSKEVLPQCRKNNKNICFYIVDRNPASQVKKLHNPKEGVYVTGEVDEIQPYLKESAAFIAPMRIARGMQTKILEAMANGVPVVTSSASSAGIGAENNHHLLVADTKEEYINQISKLLKNGSLGQNLVHNANNLLRQEFNWKKNLVILDEILEN
jgi:polysaccharide biosynthesis protein PslH